MKLETDFDSMDDDELTPAQLRRRIKKLRQTLSEKTESEKDQEADEHNKDREELADLHHEGKSKSDKYEDEEEAVTSFDEHEEPNKKDEDKKDKKSDDKDD